MKQGKGENLHHVVELDLETYSRSRLFYFHDGLWGRLATYSQKTNHEYDFVYIMQVWFALSTNFVVVANSILYWYKKLLKVFEAL